MSERTPTHSDVTKVEAFCLLDRHFIHVSYKTEPVTKGVESNTHWKQVQLINDKCVCTGTKWPVTMGTRVMITCVIVTFLINNLNIDHSKGWKYLQHAQTSDNTINLHESTECVQDRIPDDIITKLIIILVFCALMDILIFKNGDCCPITENHAGSGQAVHAHFLFPGLTFFGLKSPIRNLESLDGAPLSGPLSDS